MITFLTLNQVIASCLGLLIGFLGGLTTMMTEVFRNIEWDWGDALIPLVCIPIATTAIFFVAITIFDAATS